MMNKYFLIILTILLSSGCSEEQSWSYDQCLRRDLFKTCMTLIPKGPESTVGSNDWDEVISECGEQARMQSVRKSILISQECRIN